MSSLKLKTTLSVAKIVGLAVVGIGLAIFAASQSKSGGERVIKISAERYEYSPANAEKGRAGDP
jgi:hypothetical protein